LEPEAGTFCRRLLVEEDRDGSDTTLLER